jgi:hypothetical protein
VQAPPPVPDDEAALLLLLDEAAALLLLLDEAAALLLLPLDDVVATLVPPAPPVPPVPNWNVGYPQLAAKTNAASPRYRRMVGPAYTEPASARDG